MRTGHQGSNTVLTTIIPPASGYSVPFLRDSSGLGQALAYIRPLQRDLDRTPVFKVSFSTFFSFLFGICKGSFLIHVLRFMLLVLFPDLLKGHSVCTDLVDQRAQQWPINLRHIRNQVGVVLLLLDGMLKPIAGLPQTRCYYPLIHLGGERQCGVEFLL